jgi:hypothetical protein
LVFFTFVILAFCFWLLQYFQQKFEFEVSIPVHYTEIPTGIVLSTKLPQQISVNIQDKGTVWLQYLINKDLLIDIDLSGIQSEKKVFVVDKSILYNLIYEKLTPSTQLKSFSPERIEIDYAPLAQKKLPVVINGTLSPALGYMFSDKITINPSTVTIYGDKNMLDTLFAIKTIAINKNDIDKNLVFSTGLLVPSGAQLSAEQVELRAEVEEYTEKSFELPVHCFNLPNDRIVRFFPATTELFVQVGLNKYSQLTESDFEIGIDYRDLIKSNTTNYTLKLTKKPQWLVNYRIVPEVIEFLVEQKRDL